MRMPFKRKRIVLFVRKKDPNLGDIVIGDTCKYALTRFFGSMSLRSKIEIAYLFSEDENYIASKVKNNDAIVFPGGGVNSNKFCSAVENIMKYCDETKEIYFNAIGISRGHMTQKVRKRITALLNDPRVKQVTTRGDYDKASELIVAEKQYPLKFVLDPAIWADKTYKIHKRKESDVIGIGIIRPEIFEELKTGLTKENIYKIYAGIVGELESRGYKWQIFCNGNPRDYDFAKEFMESMPYDIEEHLNERPLKAEELVKQIACFRGVIAARFHANIIATSLNIPSVALVWNEKMEGFSQLIGCEKRYISDPDILMNPGAVVDVLDEALAEGYDEERIEDYKKETLKTLKNILR